MERNDGTGVESLGWELVECPQPPKQSSGTKSGDKIIEFPVDVTGEVEVDDFLLVHVSDCETSLRSMMQVLKLSSDDKNCARHDEKRDDEDQVEKIEAMLGQLQIMKKKGVKQKAKCQRNRREKKTEIGLRAVPSLIETVPWTMDEEQIIQKYYKSFGPNWHLIASVLNTHKLLGGRMRSPASCCYHHCLVTVRNFRSDKELRNEAVVKMMIHKRGGSKRIMPHQERAGNDVVDDDNCKNARNKRARKISRAPTDRVMETPKKAYGDYYSFFDNAMQQIKSTEDDLHPDPKICQVIDLESFHPSHARACRTGNLRLGLPESHPGQALMPHEILQLRTGDSSKKEQEQKFPSTFESQKMSILKIEIDR
mmetsp:Transcript_35470/g.57003  ORF Transcript_35470/g.57003 Transcript_35470/m.57003 type:complete len:367 (-) Transcript_35470:387-1487(-)